MQLAQSPEACSSLIFPEVMGALKVCWLGWHCFSSCFTTHANLCQGNEMLLLGKKFSAHEALKANLLNDVFPEREDKFVERVRAPLAVQCTGTQHAAGNVLNKSVLISRSGLCRSSSARFLPSRSSAAVQEGTPRERERERIQLKKEL